MNTLDERCTSSAQLSSRLTSATEDVATTSGRSWEDKTALAANKTALGPFASVTQVRGIARACGVLAIKHLSLELLASAFLYSAQRSYDMWLPA